MLVDFEYLSLYGSFELEIFHTCNQHRDGLMTKILWANKKNSNPWEGVKVGSNEIFLIATYVGRFPISFFV